VLLIFVLENENTHSVHVKNKVVIERSRCSWGGAN